MTINDNQSKALDIIFNNYAKKQELGQLYFYDLIFCANHSGNTGINNTQCQALSLFSVQKTHYPVITSWN